MGTLRLLAGFPLPVRLLVLNQAGVNLGFYLVLPYLATHLADTVGLSMAMVAVVLAVRTLSQQGLFLLGGSAADRLGARPVIIAGCAVRTAGFGLFAVAGGLPALLLAAVLSGVAGALFNPAARAYLSGTAAGRRAEAFALFQVFGNAGALLGPALGSALLLVDFRLVALVAAGVFAALTVAQAAALPRQPATRTGGSLLDDWRRCATDRRFLLFTLALAGTYTLQSQLYLVLPMQAERVTGAAVSVAALFATATVVTVLCQVRVTQWCRRRMRPGTAMAAGLAVAGVGFLLPPVGGDGGTAPGDALGWLVALAPVLAATLLLALGLVLAHPFLLERIGAFGGTSGLSGTYFGFFYLVSGVVAAAGTATVGWVAGGTAGSTAGDTAGHAGDQGGGVAATGAIGLSAWLLCAGLGIGSAAAVWLLDRGGRLEPAAGEAFQETEQKGRSG